LRRHAASVNVPRTRTSVMIMKNQALWAERLARKLLEDPLPRRWAHVRGVAAQARSLAPMLGDDADLLEAAAYLHDIGYAPDLAKTGFHPLDGARYLRDVEHADPRLCNLVAHHSCAGIEAEERGLADDLAREFPKVGAVLEDALAYCDMTTTPTGHVVSVQDRLSEIIDRYGPGNIVTRFIHRAEPILVSSVARTQRRLCQATA
jgi:putative nucleotidyltransferase with HDIG domain